VFWADSEAKVQIAPSGMMKKRRVGFSIVRALHRLWCSALVILGLACDSFRVMS
jgi:hypothetical protein